MVYLSKRIHFKIVSVKNKILFLSLFFAGQVSQAVINPLSGELSLNPIDLKTKDVLTPFKIQRYYSNKRKSFGLFGNNWCSQIEESVVRTTKGLEIRTCGQTTGSVFIKADGAFVNALGTEVMQELPNSVGFIRIAADNIFAYNEQGLLSMIAHKGQPEKPYLRIFHSKHGLIDRVVHNGKDHYIFTFKKTDKLIEKIEGPTKVKVMYEYDKKGNLIKVENAWAKKMSYSYDESGRMSSFVLPNGDKHTITYDGKLDAIAKIQDQNQCGYEFSYQADINSAKLETTVKDLCKKTTKKFSSSSSPLFSKNRVDTAALYRTPAAISPDLLKDEKGWNKIKTKTTVWDYQVDQLGNVTQIKKTLVADNSKTTVFTKYNNQRLVELSIAGVSKVNFNYKNGKLDSMDSGAKANTPDRFEAFAVYTEFLLAKNGVNNE